MIDLVEYRQFERCQQCANYLLAFGVIFILFLIKKYKYSLIVALPIFLLMLCLIAKTIPRYSSFNSQPVIWGKAVSAIVNRPVFGWGIENFETAFRKTLVSNKDFDLYNIRVDKAHNEILEYGVSGGVPAIIIYVAILVICGVKLFKNKKDHWNWTYISVLLAYIVLSQLNVVNITEYIYFYLILAMVSKLEKNK